MSVFDPAEEIVAPSIRRRSPAERDADTVSFTALRSLGIDYTQALSGRIWTDYNLHDPGVTILEQVCYALTELAYRADQPVADHLCLPDGSIDYTRQALFRPNEILRCRPTTANDYRRVLLDRIDGLADARLLAPGDDDIPGLHRLSLRLADHHAGHDLGQDAAREARAVYRAVRTFGEDLDDDVTHVTPTLCTLSLTASISGMREAADILAEIYRECAARIAGLAHVRSLGELVQAKRPIEDVLDGPVTYNGIIEETALPKDVRDGLAISDLRALVLAVEGVIEVAALDVTLDPDAPRPAPGQPWAPCLRVPGDGDHAEDLELLRHITLLRRGVKLSPDARAVASRHAHRFHPRLATGATNAEFERVLPLPRGRHRPRTPFRSVQEEFPVNYGLGRRGAGGAGNGRVALARVEQLKGYLTLFDQLLANGGAQLVNIKHLFTADRSMDRSYWRHILHDDDVPGVQAIQAVPRMQILREVYAPYDDAPDRRARVIDHLLALYGESHSQNTLRQFLDYLDSRELARALATNKAEYLRQTLLIGRDRAAGFDTGADPWKPGDTHPEPTTGLHARIALLLGFRYWRARSLTARLAGPPSRRRARPRAAPTTTPPAPRPAEDRSWALTWPDAPARPRETAATVRRLRRDANLHADLVAHAVNRERFRWLPEGKGPAGRLLLTDAHERRRDLGLFAGEPEAAQVAMRLRNRLIRLNDACEGLHIVEHILLRPRGGAAIDPDFHGLRATFVFPNWTARTSRRTFQRFARETVDINCPVHVAAQCLWLDFARMRDFEGRFAAWTARLRSHARAASPETRATTTTALDAASADLAGFLREALARQAEADAKPEAD